MREFLRGLELDQETIDTIMAEVGKRHTGLKEQVDQLTEKCKSYEADLKKANETIEGNKKSLENLEALTNENKTLKAESKMSDTNVKKEFSKFVMNEVMSKVDDKTDFETALTNYKKENPQYFGDTVVKKVQSSPSVSKGENHQTTTNDIMNDIIRGNR